MVVEIVKISNLNSESVEIDPEKIIETKEEDYPVYEGSELSEKEVEMLENEIQRLSSDDLNDLESDIDVFQSAIAYAKKNQEKRGG